MNRQELLELIDKYLAGKASKEETDRFFYFIEQPEYQDEFHSILEEQYRQGLFDTEPNEKLRQLVQARLKKAIEQLQAGDSQHGVSRSTRQHGVSRTRRRGVSRSGPRVIQIFRNKTFRWVAAASVIVIASLIVILRLSKNDNGTKPSIAQQTHDVPAPKETRAVITLADGRKVYLDSAGNGTLAQENNVNIVRNKEGEIQYMSPAGGGELNDSQNRKRPGVVYNTLFNPRGSKVISLTLSDGTKVWLNSESSLKYPIAFNNNTREVEITGEAYFEVKHNAKQPFKVHLPNGSIVEDIGTSFNINAYPDEDNIKTTLIEGEVKISASSANSAPSAFIKPGQQIEVTRNAQLITRNNVDLESTLAWKNGQFNLNSTDLAMLMRQVARWYDVDVVYRGSIPQNKFGGSISRELNLSTLLKALQQSGIDARLEDRKIIIK